MPMLGRRKHSRFLLAHPVDGHLRVRDEVAIEEWGDGELVILSPEPGKVDERLTLEIAGGSRRRIPVRVRESRPAVVADGEIRHRVRLAVEHHVTDEPGDGGRAL